MKGNVMFSYYEMDQKFDELTTAQADRLLKSGESARTFLARPEEMTVTAEINRLNKILAEFEQTSRL